MRKKSRAGAVVQENNKTAPVKRRSRPAKLRAVPKPRMPDRPARVTVVPPRPIAVRNGRIVVLHRDVFWLGRQWAVTGYGIQAVSNKFEMKYDIDVTRIWDDNLDAMMRDEPWFDAADFAEAVEVARRRSQEEPTSFLNLTSNER